MMASRLGCLPLAVLAAAACSPAADPNATLVERSHLSMGSEVRVSAWAQEDASTLAAFDAVFAEFDRLDALLSTWRPDSEIQRLNASAGIEPVPVGRDVVDVLLTARQVSEWTGGKFDVTFAALSDVWRFDQDRDGRVPSSAEVAARLPLVDYTAVQVDERRLTAFLTRAGARVNVGGIGKGYAIDRGAAILRSRGLGDFIIQAGGDLYVAGRRGERPWRVAIRDPRGPAERTFAAMDLTDATFSTSGDYERAFVRDGQRYHHILDPDTGMPARGSRSVTIVARTALLADALATGVFIMGPDPGLALIERLQDVEGVIVGGDNSVAVSSGLRERLVLAAPPTDAP
jgi:thiamine biosynthesis lipoprotein